MSNNNHTLPRAPSADRHRMIHPWLTAPAFMALELEARSRGLHPDVLAARVIDTIAADNLFAAVLDI